MRAHEIIHPVAAVIPCEYGVVEATVCYDLHILLLSYDLHRTAPASGHRQRIKSAISYVGHINRPPTNGRSWTNRHNRAGRN